MLLPGCSHGGGGNANRNGIRFTFRNGSQEFGSLIALRARSEPDPVSRCMAELGSGVLDKMVGQGNTVAQTVGHGVIGGVTAEIAGGKFQDGAVTGMAGYLLNACMHGKCFTTSEEKTLLENGDYLGYYELSCGSGDPYTCQAADIAKGQSPIAAGTTERLQAFAVDNLGRELSGDEITKIRMELASGYANYLGYSEATAKWPSALDISVIHWKVFQQFGLPPSAYGGTPFGMIPAMILGPSFYQNYPWPYNGKGWCPACDKGSLF